MKTVLALLFWSLASSAIGAPCTKSVEAGASIQTAVSISKPGDVICLRGGTYHENNVWVAASGITVTNYPGEYPVLDGSTLPGPAWATFFTLSGDNVELSGIEIRNGISPRAKGIWLRGNNNTVQNVKVDNVQDQGILITGHNALVEGSTVSRAAMANKDCALCKPARWAFGIGSYLGYNTSNTVSGMVLRGNTVSDSWGEGIQVFQAIGARVEDNVSSNNFSTNFYISASSSTVMRGNLSYNTDRTPAGLTLAEEHPLIPFSTGNTIEGNTFIDAEVRLFSWTAVPGSGLNDAVFAHNTLINSALMTGHKNANSKVQNNTIFRSDGGRMGAVPSAVGLTFSHNFWSPSRPENAAGLGDTLP